MKHVDEQRLETDLAYRYEYLAEFIGFSADDVALIHGLAPKLLARIPALVDATYDKLLSYAATARHFLPRQSGYEGPLPEGLDAISQQSELVQFRKEHLRRYLLSLVGNAYDGRMVKYLDAVGKIHTPKAGNKQIDVPLVQMNALMGLLADVLFQTIGELGLDRGQESKCQRAIGKLLWIQNDLINRHYAAQPSGQNASGRSATAPQAAAGPPTSAWR